MGKDKGKVLGILQIRVQRGINLAVRDATSCTSDPYVVVSMGHQKKKSRVVKGNCNPEWNDKLSLKVKDLNLPVSLAVYDKDTFTADDSMGDAEIDIKPYLEAKELGMQDLPPGTKLDRVQPNRKNCLSDESCIVWNYGKITQDMCLRLRNVECGEVEIQIEWVDTPECSDSDE